MHLRPLFFEEIASLFINVCPILRAVWLSTNHPNHPLMGIDKSTGIAEEKISSNTLAKIFGAYREAGT